MIAFIFPGQASQTVGMGKALADAFPEARAAFAEADAAFDRTAAAAQGRVLSEIVWDGPDDQLRLTEIQQPGILAVSVAAYRVLAAQGLYPSFVAGHSLGEYSANVAAGTLRSPTPYASSSAAAATCRRPCRSARGPWRPFLAPISRPCGRRARRPPKAKWSVPRTSIARGRL